MRPPGPEVPRPNNGVGLRRALGGAMESSLGLKLPKCPSARRKRGDHSQLSSPTLLARVQVEFAVSLLRLVHSLSAPTLQFRWPRPHQRPQPTCVGRTSSGNSTDVDVEACGAVIFGTVGDHRPAVGFVHPIVHSACWANHTQTELNAIRWQRHRLMTRRQ